VDLFGSYGPRWKGHRPFVSGRANIAQGLYDDAYFTGKTRSGEFEEDLVGWNGQLSGGIELTEHVLNFVEVYYDRSHKIELTDVFDANELGFHLETNSSRMASVELSGNMGDFFNFSRQAVGQQRQLSLFSTIRPRSNLAIDIGGTFAQTLDQTDQIDGRFTVGSLRSTYLFTRDTFLRIFAQTERQKLFVPTERSDANHLISGLFGWEYSPKSHFFVAYNETRGDGRADERVLLLKLSYLSNL